MLIKPIAEAISMADKVIVLSKSPSTIKKVYNIKLEKTKTPTENRKDKKFNHYFELIWKDIDQNV